MLSRHRHNPLQRRKPLIFFFFCFTTVVLLLHHWDLLKDFFRPKMILPIPKLIWQIFLDPRGPPGDLTLARQSWSNLNPDHALTLIDQPEVSFWLDSFLKDQPHLRRVLNNSTPLVFRADILRYIFLAQFGGVYSDVDVTALKPISTWIPEEFQGLANLVVGIEYDQLQSSELHGRWPGLEHSMQFCQWTIMAAPGHEVLRTVADRAAYAAIDLVDKQSSDLSSLELGDNQVVISTTGPGIWTTIILEYLRKKLRPDLQYSDFGNITEPTLFDDILVLPINAFATSQEHSGSIQAGSPDALVKHAFRGSWKVDDQFYSWKSNRVVDARYDR